MIGSYPAYGIELADGALKAVKLVRRGRRLVVTWAAYVPYARAEDGSIRPRAGLFPRARAALRAFLQEAGPRPLDRVYVGMPAVATFNRLIRVPDVGAERLDEIARYEAHRSLRGPVEDYLVRTRVLRRRSDQIEIPCLLFAVRRNLVSAFVADLAAERLATDNLIPSPAALALFVRYDRPAAADRIVVSIGLQATEVVYMRDRGHAFRTLPLGVVGLVGLGATARAAAARLLVERLAAEIGKGSSFFFGAEQGFRAESIALFGEGAAVAEIADEFRRRFPMPVEEIGELHRIAVAPGVSGEARARLSQMGSALGLAIAAAREGDPHIELLEPDRARNAARRTPALAAAGLLLSLCTFALAEHEKREAVRFRAATVSPSPDELRRRGLHEEGLLAGAREVADRERDLEAFFAGRVARARAFGDVLRHFGPGISEFGESEFQLLELEVDRREDGASWVAGRARAPLLDLRAATVLRQRLAQGSGLLDVKVAEIEAERDAFAETVVLGFAGRLARELP